MKSNISNSQSTSETKELQPLFAVMEEAREAMVKSLILDKIEKGELSVEEWKDFAVQRYLASLHFENLLTAGLQLAREAGDETMIQALESNLNDETGMTSVGTIDPKLSHCEWRKDFYSAIDITPDQLNQAIPKHGTQLYGDELEKLSHETLFHIAGALLILEYTIPYEFKRIQIGRDKSFPEKFVSQPNDTSEIRTVKERASLYINDHIQHDARSHYPNLLHALKPYLSDIKSFAQIKEGIQRVATAKKEFYTDLENRGVKH